MFWPNKRKIDFSWLSSDSRHSEKITLKYYCPTWVCIFDIFVELPTVEHFYHFNLSFITEEQEKTQFYSRSPSWSLTHPATRFFLEQRSIFSLPLFFLAPASRINPGAGRGLSSSVERHTRNMITQVFEIRPFVFRWKMSMVRCNSVITSTCRICKICFWHILVRMSFFSQTMAVSTECWSVEHCPECYRRWILAEVM